MIAVIGFDGRGKRIGFEIGADAGLNSRKYADVAGVSKRVRTYAERAAVSCIDGHLDGGLGIEQFSFINKLGPASDEVLRCNRHHRFGEIRIQIMAGRGVVSASPDEAG